MRDLPAYTDGVAVPWWALAAAFAVTEVFVIHAHVRGSAHTLSLSELPLVVGLLLAAPQDLVRRPDRRAGARPAVRARAARRPRSPSTSPSSRSPRRSRSLVLHALAPAPAEIGPGVWSATFAAVGAGSLVAARAGR